MVGSQSKNQKALNKKHFKICQLSVVADKCELLEEK